jgi:hypothetical protein
VRRDGALSYWPKIFLPATSLPARAAADCAAARAVHSPLIADPRLLQCEPHEIIKKIADRTARGADLIEAALATGTELYVNEMANIDSDAYRILAGLTV